MAGPDLTFTQTERPITMPKIIGYARVSTSQQDLEPQIIPLKNAGCSEIFTDHGVSGASKDRPAFNAAMASLDKGDRLVVCRLDRMGRSLKHLIEINEELTSRGVSLESLNEKIDTSTAIGNFVFQILGAVAELEREIIRERTMAGLAAAAKRGRFPGRPKKQAGQPRNRKTPNSKRYFAYPFILNGMFERIGVKL